MKLISTAMALAFWVGAGVLSFGATIGPLQPPVVVTCPAPIVADCSGPDGTVVKFTPTATSTAGRITAITSVPASGSVFPMGVTTVKVTAVDALRNSAQCSFTVTVRDTISPELTVPASIEINCVPPGGKTVDFTVTATDNCDSNLIPVCHPPSGTLFPIGTTPVQCIVRDGSGNATTKSFNVILHADATAPVITVPEATVVNCALGTGAKVEFVATALDDCSGPVNVLCQPASGSIFKIGTTTVIARAVDAAGNVASKNFTVTVNADTAPPAISVPAAINAACTSPAGAVVNFNVLAEDLCDNPVTVVSTPPSGSQFPMGKTTVDCVATDKAGNSVHGTFDVLVSSDCARDCITLICPADVTVECSGVTGRAVEFTAQASSRCSTVPVTLTYTKAPGSVFPLGKTVVTCSAVDDKGNSATCQFSVTVVDTTAPVFGSLPSPKAECTNPEGAVVTFEAMAIDQCDGIISASCTPPSGSLFPIGTTAVSAVAMDTSGNKTTVSFNVVVTAACLSDCIQVTCPGDITVSLVQGNDIQVEYPAATATNTCTGQTLAAACYPPSGSVFHTGKTKVDCMAIDLGTRQNCQFTVTVLDPIPPKFRRLPTITKECDGLYSGVGGGGIGAPKGGAFVSYTITATDNADPNPTVVCNPASGSFFPLGTNVVTCTATDASGNSASSSFKVVVVSGPACEVSADAGGLGLEPPDNWGFELGLVSWKGTGSAFATNIQPILGDRVATIRIGDLKKNIEQKLGGDYWHDVTYPIGYKGQRWIGTAEGQLFGIPFVGEELTGTLLSKRFVIKHKYINFLMGGGADLGNLKAEVLIRTGVPGPQNELIDGDYYTRGDIATGHAEEVMHRLEWNVSAYVNKYAYIRLTDNSTTGHINVDDFRFSDTPVEQQQVRVGDKYYPAVVNFNGFDFDWDAPVWGFGDLHTHPFSYLGFGGKIVHGEFYGDLTDCRCSHGGWGFDNECGNYWRQLLQMAMDDKGNDAHGFGIVGPNQSQKYDQYWPWKQFRNWPTFSSVTHQQMYRDWLMRAYDGGLRVLVALCVNNPLLAHAARGNLPGDDKSVSELQIKALRDWVADDNLYPKYSFVEIANDPVQLRDIVRRNKLAIIIGSELDDFGNFASNPLIDPDNPSDTAKKIVRDEIDRMYDKLGVRYIFPIHLMDNTFGGTAIGSDMLNFATKYLMGRAFKVTKADANDHINFWLSDFNSVKINIDGKNYSFDPGVLAVVGSIAGSILIPALGPIVGAVADAMFPVAPGSGAALGAGLGPIMTVAMIGALPVLVGAIADTPIPLNIAPLPGNYPTYPTKQEAPHGVRNWHGLSKLGSYAIDYMMKRGMMIDVDHMSQYSFAEMIGKAQAIPGGYPVNSGHNSFRELGLEVNENHRTTLQMDQIRKLGGMMGVGWENGPAHDFDLDDQKYSQSSIDNDCAGTSKTFSQNYLFALEQMHGSHVAFGTDMDGLIAAPGPRFGPQSAFALPSPDNESLIDSDHTTLDRAWDIGRQSDGVAYSPKHGKPLTTAAFVGNAVDPNKNTDGTSYSKGYRYNQDQRDFYAAIRIFFWFKHMDGGIPSESQTDYDIDQIKNGLHDSYPDKDRIKRYALGMIKGIKNWDLHNDEEKIGKAVVRTKQNNEDVPDYLDSSDKRTRYYRMLSVWDDYLKIFGNNAPLTRCSYDKKEWDYNFEGVAHYGLLPDFLQDLSNVGLKPKDMGVLFKSAEDFAQMWVKTLNASDAINHPELHVPFNPDIAGGILKLQWYAEDGDELEESDQIGDPSSWRHLPVDLTPGTGQAEANIKLNTSRARFFRVKKK